METRLFVIPDVHGRFDLLDQLLTSLYHDEHMNLTRDKLIFTGDLVDRGPQSKEVVERLSFMTEFFPNNVIVLKGNHEDMMLKAITSGNMKNWHYNGGRATADSFDNEYDPSLMAWLQARPYIHKEHGFVFTHAPLPRKEDIADPYTLDELTWTYRDDDKDLNTNLGFESDGTKIIGVAGHIHRLEDNIMNPRFMSNCYLLDCGSGCHPDAPLVAVEVKSKKIVYSWPRV